MRVSGGHAVRAVQVVHGENNDEDEGAVVLEQIWSPSRCEYDIVSL